MKKVNFFTKDEIGHIYNRGVEKRNIFMERNDYLRFIYNLVELNNAAPAELLYERHSYIDCLNINPSRQIDLISGSEPLVEVLAFVLMPNHFHLLLKQKMENGISKFMQKIGVGYSMFFNKKYDRVGGLFQGTYKAIQIKSEAHLIHLPFYIHANPLDLLYPEWRESKIKNINRSIEFLNKYRWSSLSDYTGQSNFPTVIQRDFLLKFLGGTEKYKREFFDWLKEMDLSLIRNYLIE